MRVAVIGAGISGLTCAYFLSQKGHQVFIFEKENDAGGLAGYFNSENWEWPLEKFYHHFFPSDTDLISLVKELNINQKLRFEAPITSIFVQNKIHRFDNPKAILKFPFLSIIDKLRTGVTTAFLKTNCFWKPLEKITASNFIKKTMGENSYKILWEPLLKSKFGSYSERIPASWFWTRIKKRSSLLGYFEGGDKTLINALLSKIQENGGKIFLNTEIKNLNSLNRFGDFDRIVLAVPHQTLLKIVPELPQEYVNKINKLEMIGCLNLVFSLEEQFLTDNTYWLNIDDSSFPFVAVVEHTNFMEPEHYGGKRLLYVGGYYPQNHRFFKMKKEEILKEFLPFLKKINPYYNLELCTLNFELFSNLYAQPIPTLNYSQTLLPSIKTPVPNLYWASLHHVYPQDRGVNYAIKLGKKVADEITKSK